MVLWHYMLIEIFTNLTLSLAILFAFSWIIFIIAQYKKDNSVMDIFYGPLFLLTALTMLMIKEVNSPYAMIVFVAITIWSLRLGTRIYFKNAGKPEDARYAAWRKEWMEKGRLYFFMRSYLQINLFQCLIIAVVLLPFTIAYSAVYPQDVAFELNFYQYFGLGLFIFGLLYESLADWQLDKFLARKRAGTETATLMTIGLFRFSRRPNYFGESMIWWGLAIFAFTLPYGYMALLSPILITYIVVKITGPMLEKQFIARYPTEYGEYMKKTSYFIPLPPRK